MKKKIICQICVDWVAPYCGDLIPIVIESTHPNYNVNTRFDYGFMQNAIKDGYEILIKPLQK